MLEKLILFQFFVHLLVCIITLLHLHLRRILLQPPFELITSHLTADKLLNSPRLVVLKNLRWCPLLNRPHDTHAIDLTRAANLKLRPLGLSPSQRLVKLFNNVIDKPSLGPGNPTPFTSRQAHRTLAHCH